MRHKNFVALNEFVPTGTNTAATAVYTGAHFNDDLGKHNHLALHVVIDNLTIGTTGHLYGFLENSADGRNWIQRSNQANSFASTDADIDITLTSGTTTLGQAMWSDSCLGKTAAGPMLGFTRIRFFFSQSNISGHLKVHATQREGG